MRVLVTGAGGFIASHLVTALLEANHHVICGVRAPRQAALLFPAATAIFSCDFLRDLTPQHWLERLHDVDAVINCVGILHHPNPNVMWKIHYEGPRALFDACVQKGIKQVIQISALGIDRVFVPYATSKKAIEDHLLTLPLRAIILRPSLVYGKGSYGGTSLFRGLASLPGLLPLPGSGEQTFQPILLDDLTKAITILLRTPLPQSVILSAVGPTTITLKTLLTTLRAWLGIQPVPVCPIPLPLIRVGAWLGNGSSQSTLNKNAYAMLKQHNIATPAETDAFHQAIGFVPRPFQAGLYHQPSTVQDHWHARLYWFKPLLQGSIAFVWLYTAFCCLFLYPKQHSYAWLTKAGTPLAWQPLCLYGASLLDAFLGLGTLFSTWLRPLCLFQIALIVGYSLLIGWKLPELWFDPFGSLAKNIPLLVATGVLWILASSR